MSLMGGCLPLLLLRSSSPTCTTRMPNVSCLLSDVGVTSIHGRLDAFHETTSGHLRIQCFPGADPGRGPSAHNAVEIQIMFLGSNTNQHPQGSTAGVATIHHCDVQQIPPRGSTSILPEVCDPFANCQEVRAGC